MMITYDMICETGERVTFTTDSMKYLRTLQKEVRETPREHKASPIVVDIEVTKIERGRTFTKP